MRRTAGVAPDQTVLLADIVADHAERQPDAMALLAETGSLTYAALNRRCAGYAHWALEQDLRPGDTVALMLGNCPDYLAIWLGLSSVGVVTALLNTQLAGAALNHCITIAAPKFIIVGAHLFDPCRAAIGEADAPPLWVHGADAPGLPRIDTAMAFHGGGLAAARQGRRVTLEDRALLIYTSGTTGLPKAAYVSHYRIRMWSEWFAGLMDVTPDDRLYDCLPMYHSVGGVVATGAMLAGGASVAVRERFSATRFWDDVIAWDCTIFQYIGELCRYLVNQPDQGTERAHRLRLCCGNGLRADVWDRFQSRFAIPQIMEFYAATEGSFSLFNMEARTGSIGRVPGFMAHRSPIALVRFDMDRAMPVRTGEGLCIRCGPDETGEALGRLADRDTGLSTRFEGYTDHAASEQKILRDVFVKGDAWFRTGDLMRKDAKGFYYFVDRVGDTFRWKGENVAASEVEAALCLCPGVTEANVYGVEVPGADGRAGMAALVVDQTFDLKDLCVHLAVCLPSFARPLFLRLQARMEITATFKPRKQTLVAEGYDPHRVTEPLFIHDAALAAYIPLDHGLHHALISGQRRI